MFDCNNTIDFFLDGYAFSQEENGAVLQVRNTDIFNIVKRFVDFSDELSLYGVLALSKTWQLVYCFDRRRFVHVFEAGKILCIDVPETMGLRLKMLQLGRNY